MFAGYSFLHSSWLGHSHAASRESGSLQTSHQTNNDSKSDQCSARRDTNDGIGLSVRAGLPVAAAIFLQRSRRSERSPGVYVTLSFSNCTVTMSARLFAGALYAICFLPLTATTIAYSPDGGLRHQSRIDSICPLCAECFWQRVISHENMRGRSERSDSSVIATQPAQTYSLHLSNTSAKPVNPDATWDDAAWAPSHEQPHQKHRCFPGR